MAEKDVLGQHGEERAAEYLSSAGYTVLARNWRCRHGELDLVASRGTDLVVVEVKTRSTTKYGHPAEAITPGKRARLRRLAVAWVSDHREQSHGLRLRLDAICLVGADPASAQLEHLQDIA